MSTEVIDVLLPCALVAGLYGAGIITGLVIAKADAWMQGLGPKEAP
ncbi:hypothetical protein GCM10007870_27800 [Gluconobacter kondonii]|uniref:Uncharacterized protein n=1 Tax=Gluconobacter kondonii TaxID=941463 RepID=A0ABQ5WVW8_9PROT|nr:hypothetical protein AA3266_1990 [Gluconobacter kondonii NBRC 3266]GLQ67195.1 hypothetical protein GCM10007870_27800 [Gluconobacter kondonii]